MGIDSLFTLRIVSDQTQNVSGKPALPTSDILPGANFFDLFLARISDAGTENSTAEKGVPKDGNGNILQSKNPLLEKMPKLDLTRLLSENENIAEDAKALEDVTGDSLPHILALNQKAFDDILRPIEADPELTAQEKQEKIYDAIKNIDISEILFIDSHPQQSAVNKIKIIAEKLQQLSQDGGPQLILTNLTPSDMAELKEYLADASKNAQAEAAQKDENKDQNAAQGVFLGLISIVMPENLRLQTGAATAKPETTTGTIQAAATPAPAHHAPLPPLDESIDAQSRLPQNASAMAQAVAAQNQGKGTGSASEKTSADKTAQTESAPAKQTADSIVRPSAQTAGFDANILTQPGAFDSMASGLHSDLVPAHAGSAPVTGAQNFAALVTNAPHAAQAHPTAHMIAMTLQNAGVKGKDTNISLQLDPPELGRIEVSMQFGKDKNVKAALMIEKPETYAMLQRDSHLLERALQDAGLDVSGDALSFDLAQDGYDFNHNGRHDGDAPARGNDSGAESGTEIAFIQSSPDWHIDPETGHTRYSLLA